MPAHSRVNLLPPSEFELSFWGRFLRWAVTTGRYIIVLAELLVILAFLSRFKLDEDLRNINEQINGQVNFLERTYRQESEFRQLQNKIALTKKYLDLRPSPYESLDYLDKRLPDEVVIRTWNINMGEFSFSAETQNEKAMGKIMATMSGDKKWKSIDVTQLYGEKVSGIKFSITAK